jgi:hypothetical protein
MVMLLAVLHVGVEFASNRQQDTECLDTKSNKANETK